MNSTLPFEHHIQVAQGYVELGMFLDANAEIETIEAELRNQPEVLAVRREIYTGLKRWERMRIVAKSLTNHDPDEAQWSISLAYATRRAESIDATKVILLEAVERHPKAPMLHYNLACYECQLGDVEVAKTRLQHAFKLEPRLRLIAMEDEDLEAVWASLKV